MDQAFSIALAQVNTIVGAITQNMALIRRERALAKAQDVDFIIFPELALIGYPPEDLVLRPAFRQAAMAAMQELAKDTADNGPAMLVGGVWEENGAVYNAVALLDDGKIKQLQYKHDLPNYDVFDEKRIFKKASTYTVMECRGKMLGVVICEDTWTPDAAKELAAQGAEILISVNASPYDLEKHIQRVEIATSRSAETGLPLLYLNSVGGQDEIVFDGHSFVISGQKIVGEMPHAKEATGIVRLEKGALYLENSLHTSAWAKSSDSLSEEKQIYETLVLGVKDYFRKTGITGAILGLSGGVDSALVAAIAVDALGKENVRGVRMPSRYSAADSLEDAEETAKILGIRMETIPIEPVVKAMGTALADVFAGYAPNVAEENIQARVRGNLLMALSNKIGWAVLNTSNKSEMAVGYSTLYGDMCGAYAVLKDVYKTQVYRLCEWRNSQNKVIPERSITKPPTAELRENQKDSDSLPDYPVLDAILHGLVEERLSVAEIVARGFEAPMVEKVKRLLHFAEYKRRQTPPGTKITPLAFGKEWRYPIAAKIEI